MMRCRRHPEICNECGKRMTEVDTYPLEANYPSQHRVMKIYKCLDPECTGYGDRCPVEVNA